MIGATGYVGTLITTSLLTRGTRPVVALVRNGQGLESFRARLLRELANAGQEMASVDLDHRLTLVPLPDPLADHDSLASELVRLGVNEVVHCAGCVDYFNAAELEHTNVVMTEWFLGLAKRVGVARFTYISTAYSSGCIEGVVPEQLHPDETRDPNDYVRTKRRAECLIAESSIPYLIVRPSVIIGDSRTGYYSGKRYGLYQHWVGVERLLYDRPCDEMHVVAPTEPVNFLHQDAFQNAFHWAFEVLPPDSIMNLTSDSEGAPSVRDLWKLWFEVVREPDRLHYYESLEQVPLKGLPPRQRAFVMFASGNLEITAHRWRFETRMLDRMRSEGVEFTDADLQSIRICQGRFLDSSSRMQRYLQ